MINHIKWVLPILLLLIVQAYCELSLPAYTSDIVDVGIQNGGIEYATPERLRSQTMEDLELFMPDEDLAKVEAAYEMDGGVYVLKNMEDKEALDGVFSLPMAMLGRLSSGEGGYDISQVRAAIKAGVMTKDQLIDKAGEALKAMGSLSDTVISAAAIGYLKNEYAAMGLELDKIRLDYLWSVGSRMIALTLLMVAAAVLASLMGSRVGAAIGRELREKVFSKVLSFSAAEINRFSTASLITRSTNDIQQVQMVCVILLRIVLYAPIIGIGGIIKVASTRTGLGWIIAVAIVALLFVLAVLMIIAMPRFKKMQELVDKLNLVSREILTGLQVIRAFNREKHEEKRFEAANTDLMRTQLFVNRAMSFMMPSMMFILSAVTLLIEWFGAKGIDLGTLQVGDMIAFITYTLQIVIAFMMITAVSIFLPRAAVAAGRIDEIINTSSAVSDKETNLDERLADAKGIVAFEDVSFRYPDSMGEEALLSHISFTAYPGQTTAIIGATGSGKSTLANLLLRFYDVTEGRITIDGIDIRELSQSRLRELLGYVPQKGVLFSGDIESNIKYGGSGISDEAMKEAAEIAQAKDFIEEKAEGYHSPIAQGGANVSGGQKQRLSIARAIAKNPKIYIFDDSFSALDYKTDSALRKALHKKAAEATLIIVAQRISTILHADRIIVMSGGTIEAIGRHEELLKESPTYREIARSQLSARELGEEE